VALIRRLKEVHREEHEVIASVPGLKILLPLIRAEVEIVGLIPEPLPHQGEKAITGRLKEFLKHV
jgi:hypothetical protein